MGAGADLGAAHESGAGPDAGIRTHKHRTNMEGRAVQPRAGQVNARLHRSTGLNSQKARYRRDGLEVHIAANLVAHHPRHQLHKRGARNVQSARGGQPLLRSPHPQMHRAAARVHARRNPPPDQAGAPRSNGNAPHRGAKQQPRHQHHREGSNRGEQTKRQQEPHQGRCRPKRYHRKQERELAQSHACVDRRHGSLALGEGRGGRVVVDKQSQSPKPRVVIQVTHRERGDALAQPGDQRRGRQRGAAEREEIRIRAGHVHPKDLNPQAGDPMLRRAQPFNSHSGGQRPRQRVFVHLAGGANRQLIHHMHPRHERRRHHLGKRGAHRRHVQRHPIFRRDVAHQHLVAGAERLHRHRGVVHALQGRNVCLNLAQLNAAPADLDLVVGAPDERQALVGHPHVVAGPIRPRPMHIPGVPRSVLLRVLRRVQVAREPHATDDQFAIGRNR